VKLSSPNNTIGGWHSVKIVRVKSEIEKLYNNKIIYYNNPLHVNSTIGEHLYKGNRNTGTLVYLSKIYQNTDIKHKFSRIETGNKFED
jgi:hypothetical protein